MKGRLPKAKIDEILTNLGYDETARAEQLELSQIQQLAESLRVAELAESDSDT
jgi:16S rRNA (adenine1518-N6/adenine1519-N6)-dimethyltransferase